MGPDFTVISDYGFESGSESSLISNQMLRYSQNQSPRAKSSLFKKMLQIIFMCHPFLIIIARNSSKSAQSRLSMLLNQSKVAYYTNVAATNSWASESCFSRALNLRWVQNKSRNKPLLTVLVHIVKHNSQFRIGYLKTKWVKCALITGSIQFLRVIQTAT